MTLSSNEILIIVAVALLLIFVVLFIIFLKRKTKKNKEQKNQIPADILVDFMEAEKRMKDSHGEADPIQILWDIAKKRNIQLKSGEIDAPYQKINSMSELSGQSVKNQPIKKLNQYQSNPINRIKKEAIENGENDRKENDSKRSSTSASSYGESGTTKSSKRKFRFKKPQPEVASGELYPQPSGREDIQSTADTINRQQYTAAEGAGGNDEGYGSNAGRTIDRGRPKPKRRRIFRR